MGQRDEGLNELNGLNERGQVEWLQGCSYMIAAGG